MLFGTIGTKMKVLLIALKILDPDNTISLTNIGVMVVLVKIGSAPTIDWPTISALLLSLLSYNFKRKLNRDAETAEAEAANKLQELAQTESLKLAEVEKKIAELNQAFAVKSMLR
jgi:hypothetical protein